MDGFVIDHLPEQVDDQTTVSDFSYEWEGVRFETRVWEKRLEEGAVRVVLQVLVMRGDELTGLSAVRAFLAKYHERPPDWDLSEFDHNGTPGLSGQSEAFWTPAAGVAVEVRDPFGLIGSDEVVATARGIGPA